MRAVTLLACLLSAALGLACTHAAAPAAPNPALDPAQVVQLQLDAMREGTDAGLATVFGFASPGNRQQTGPVERFRQMIRAAYPEMLRHRNSKLAPTVVDGDHAIQGVELVAEDGQEFRYVFILSRQRETPFEGCWMTDSVIRPEELPRRRDPEA